MKRERRFARLRLAGARWRIAAAVVFFLLPGRLSLARGENAAAPAIPTFNGQRAFDDIKHLVDFGPRPPGSKAIAESRRWIIGKLKEAGCQVEEDPFTGDTPLGPIPMTNVVAKIPGASPAVIMLAGHYDTLRLETGRFVGANDGGSSAAFLLEMARLLAHRKNPVTYWLVFFDGEEALRGWTATDSDYGSRHLASKLAADGELSRIKAMILVDMIGDSNLDVFRDDNSTAWLRQIVLDSARRLGLAKYFDGAETPIDDDHRPFVNAGVSAVDLIGIIGPIDAAHTFGIYWHTPKDTPDKCSPQSLATVGRVVTATLEELENSAHVK
ncbi:MAG: M28 family peptidase [Terriglobia bacterium]